MLYQCGTLAQVLREFDEYQLDILHITEMSWTGSGKNYYGGKTILYSGHGEQLIQGIGVMLNKEVEKAFIGWKPTSD